LVEYCLDSMTEWSRSECETILDLIKKFIKGGDDTSSKFFKELVLKLQAHTSIIEGIIKDGGKDIMESYQALLQVFRTSDI